MFINSLYMFMCPSHSLTRVTWKLQRRLLSGLLSLKLNKTRQQNKAVDVTSIYQLFYKTIRLINSFYSQ